MFPIATIIQLFTTMLHHGHIQPSPTSLAHITSMKAMVITTYIFIISHGMTNQQPEIFIQSIPRSQALKGSNQVANVN